MSFNIPGMGSKRCYNNHMRGIWVIIKWEISRLYSNWRKAAAIFILPAAVMMIALGIFPYLINYMTTGALGEKPITVINAPSEFLQYIEDTEGTTVYSYEYQDIDEFTEDWESGQVVKDLRGGSIFVFFETDARTVYVGFNGNSSIANNKAESFIEVVMTPYNESLQREGQIIYEVDSFNPVMKLLDYRSDANFGAARVIPPVLVLLIYYCIYSLTSDMFASERDRGFYDKLLMSPVSPIKIMMGKILSCTLLVTGASYVTFLFLFLSSWLNRSNSSTSLIPFGLFLLPNQLKIVAIVIPITAFVCSAVCVNIIFSIKRMKDVVLNLQMPLVYLMGDLFYQIFSVTPGVVEFYIPIHGSIAVIKSVFLSEYQPWQFWAMCFTSLTFAFLLMMNTFRKEGYIGDKRK